MMMCMLSLWSNQIEQNGRLPSGVDRFSSPLCAAVLGVQFRLLLSTSLTGSHLQRRILLLRITLSCLFSLHLSPSISTFLHLSPSFSRVRARDYPIQISSHLHSNDNRFDSLPQSDAADDCARRQAEPENLSLQNH